MNKFFLSIGLTILSLMGVSAQPFSSVDLLAVPALSIGTNGAGASGWTNLSLLTTNVGMVYGTNILYTNAAGQQIRGYGITNTQSTQPLFNTAPLFTDRNGNPISYVTFTGNGVVPGRTNESLMSPLTLLIEVVNNRGSNGPIGLVFAPVWDQPITVGGSPQHVVNSARNDDWSVILPGLAAGKYIVPTNVPTWRWPGAYGFTLRYMTNFHDDAGIGAMTNGSFVTALKVVGYRP